MKKLLIIALLFWGCDYAPTDHTHEHEHDDIYGCTDSTSTNFDSTATIFDNTCAYPNTVFEVDWVLIKQLGASEGFYISGEWGFINVVDTGYVFIHTDSSNVNITSELPFPSHSDVYFNPHVDGCVADSSVQALQFTHNDEEFSYDISNAIINFTDCSTDGFCIDGCDFKFNIYKTIAAYNIKIDTYTQLVYLYDNEGEVFIISIDDPNELVDYR